MMEVQPQLSNIGNTDMYPRGTDISATPFDDEKDYPRLRKARGISSQREAASLISKQWPGGSWISHRLGVLRPVCQLAPPI